MLVSKLGRVSGIRRCAQARLIGTSGSSGWSPAPIAESNTPPAAWYITNDAHHRDLDRIFSQGWRLADVFPLPASSFKAGTLPGLEFLLTSDEQGTVKGFHNVCRHHSAIVASGQGPAGPDCRFTCPYHGWQYDRSGRLVLAPRIKGMQCFKPRDYGLSSLSAARWAHHFTFINPSAEPLSHLSAWIGDECTSVLTAAGVADAALQHVASREYHIACNWKVFADNYLDGGYHVPVAHGALAAHLQLEGYRSLLYPHASVQLCSPISGAGEGGNGSSRVSTGVQREVAYAFIFPNLMINRYGPWMDVNIVHPTSATTCSVTFHWWLEDHLVQDTAFIEDSLASSDQVQQEDIALCESVQRGLQSRGFRPGRYVPSFEAPMHHFHHLLHHHYLDASLELATPR